MSLVKHLESKQRLSSFYLFLKHGVKPDCPTQSYLAGSAQESSFREPKHTEHFTLGQQPHPGHDQAAHRQAGLRRSR